MSQRSAAPTSTQLAFAVSTVGANTDGDGVMSYVGDSTSTIDMGLWHHFAGTYDGRSVKVFVDGRLTTSDDESQRGEIYYPDVSYEAREGGWFTLGAYHDANEYYPINGLMDEVRIWNTALDVDEIAHNQCSDGLTGTEPGLLHFWKLDENDGTRIANAVPGAPEGAILGNVLRTPHEELCLYAFEHGALDFSYGSIDSGHVAVPVVDISQQLPVREMTVESWIKWYGGVDWAGPVSAVQDDGSTEKGFALSSRCSGDECIGGLTMAFAISTVGGNSDGDGMLTYVGCEDGATGNGGGGTRDPRAKIGSTPDAAAALGEWVHIAGVYDGAVAKLFVNGRDIGASSATSVRGQSGDILYPDLSAYSSLNGGWMALGAYHDANEYYPVNGVVDEVRLWNVARSIQDINAAQCDNLPISDPQHLDFDYGAGRGLAHYWMLDEDAYDVVYDSAPSPLGNALDGTLVGDVTRQAHHTTCHADMTSGEPGCNDPKANNYVGDQVEYDHSCTYDFDHGALDFSHDDTSDGHVSVPITVRQLPVRDITVEAWVKYYAGVEWAGPVSFGGDDGSFEKGVFMSQREASAESTKLAFALSTDGADDSNGDGVMTYITSDDDRGRIDMNVWHHFAGTYDGSLALLYVDGVQVASLPDVQTGNINYPSISYASGHGGWFTLGAYHDANEYYPINGLMDEVRIWNVAVDADEIMHNKCAELTGYELNLMHFWKSDEREGDIVANAVPSSPDGVMVGGVARAEHEDLCLYSFEHGALDFSYGSIDSGHVAVPVVDISQELPVREMTVESWIKWYGGTDWAGPVTAAQDDGSTEKGFALSSRCSGDECIGGLTMAFAISTVGGNSDGDGMLTYVGCEDGATGNGGGGTRDPRAKIGSTPDAAAALGEWVHIAGVYDGAVASLYLNGDLIVTSATSVRGQSGDILYPDVGERGSYQAVNGGWFTIGAYHDANEYYPVNGVVDDVRLWNVARTAQQIVEMKCGTLPMSLFDRASAQGLMHYWMLDENAGFTAYDRAPACFDSCIHEGMDYGGEGWNTDSGIQCGYAPVVAIIADKPTFARPAWSTRDGIPVSTDASMDSPEECQARCNAHAECSFFSYKWEQQPSGGFFHQCYLKTHYPFTPEQRDCNRPPHYVEWAHESREWHGASGPKTCQDVASGCAHGFLLGDVTRVSHATSCSGSTGAIGGCNDESATNFNPATTVYDHSCTYNFEKGCLDLTHASIDSGHVSVPLTAQNFDHLPQREITVETWIKWYGGTDWAGPVTAAQDDGGSEKGWALSSRCGGTVEGAVQCDQGVTMAFAISTELANVQDPAGDGSLTYVGCDDGDQANGGGGIRDPRAAASLGEWVHFAGNYDGSVATLFVNGQPIVTSATSTRQQGGNILYPHPSYSSANGGWFTIGAYHDANEYVPVNGLIDEMRIWSVARTQADIMSSLCGSIDEPTIFASPELMHYWMFDEHEGAVIANAVPGGAPGIMQGDIARKPGLGDPLESYDVLPGCAAAAGNTGGVRPPPPPYLPPPSPPPSGGPQSACCSSGDADVTPQVLTVSTDGWRTGYETYRLQATLSGQRTSIYAIYGDNAIGVLQVPPAFQADAPFGKQFGGTNPVFFAINADSEYDSWLTVGIEDGDNARELSSVGLDLEAWTETSGVTATDGAVFFMDPEHGSSGNVLLAQLTVPSTGLRGERRATMGAQGQAMGQADDWQTFLTFTF